MIKTEFNEYLNKGLFARHETFCPRYGWLKKGFDGVLEAPDIFDRTDAIEKLGVGKNMVRAIRFWCLAFKVVAPKKRYDPPRLSGPMEITTFGRKLFSEDNGWDPFSEDPASLWLLHWQLFTPPIIATAWSMAINLSSVESFTPKDMARAMIEQKKKIPGLNRYSDASVEKDASCFFRMYAPPGKQASGEIECPFSHLSLLVPGNRRQTCRFNMEYKTTLPDRIVLAACFDYAHHFQPNLRTLSLSKIAYGPNSPGTVFRLSESDLGRILEKTVPLTAGARFTESYGNRHLHFEVRPETLCMNTLNQYFRSDASGGFVR